MLLSINFSIFICIFCKSTCGTSAFEMFETNAEFLFENKQENKEENKKENKKV